MRSGWAAWLTGLLAACLLVGWAQTAAAQTTTTATDTTPARTETRTVTGPEQTTTVTETSTESPGNTSITNRTATVQVTPVSGTATGDQSDSSGLPAWAWVLIGLGAVLIGLVMFLIGRRGRKPPDGPGDARRPEAPSPYQ